MTLKINAKSTALYALYAVAVIFINKTLAEIPFSLGLCFAMLACGTNIILTPLIYLLASIVYLDWIATLLCLFEAVFLGLVTFIYRKTKRKIRIEAAAYLAIALAPYIAFARWQPIAGIAFLDNEYAFKGFGAVAVIIFTYFSFKTVYALMYRAMRCKLKEDELVCCAVVYAAFGTGLYNVCGFFPYTAIASGAIIFSVRLARSPSALIYALITALPPSVANLSVEPFSIYVFIATIALLFSGAGRAAPSVIVGAVTALYCYFKGGFDCSVVLIVFRALLLLCTALLPAVFSDNYLKSLKYRLLVKEILPDTAVERSRRRTGEKLYRISEVFREIECAFNALDDDINDSASRNRMLEELKEKCCKNCDRAKLCAKTNVYSGFKKLIDSGCIRGKVNLIDLPSEVTVNCSNPTDVLLRLNALIAEYRRFITEAENAKNGRILLADQARGVAEVMKNCAVELSRSSREYAELEKELQNKLSTQGISCPELYVDGENMEILAVISGRIDLKTVTKILNETTNKNYLLKDKLSYDGEKSCLVFSAPPRLDAAFGVAYAIKSGESVSGDTHSVIKINEHSFLMALSDGMGSGKYAKKVSATAISLIEAFYRAEMPEGTVLNTINKLLSFNRDERFTCIDIAAINLSSGMADFVKIGSPAGIIVREGEIKVLESQSLPLGILENLRPTVCTEQLRAGDIVVFMSDGITSAFSSTTELYEYLQGLKPLNPQNLADTILKTAKEKAKTVTDDMTVLCTRIFETKRSA